MSLLKCSVNFSKCSHHHPLPALTSSVPLTTSATAGISLTQHPRTTAYMARIWTFLPWHMPSTRNRAWHTVGAQLGPWLESIRLLRACATLVTKYLNITSDWTQRALGLQSREAWGNGAAGSWRQSEMPHPINILFSCHRLQVPLKLPVFGV